MGDAENHNAVIASGEAREVRLSGERRKGGESSLYLSSATRRKASSEREKRGGRKKDFIPNSPSGKIASTITAEKIMNIHILPEGEEKNLLHSSGEEKVV